jgi:acyl carrier protein
MLAAIWAEVLQIDVEHFGAQSDFFELGGHSLLGTLVISRIRARTGIEVPLRRIFEFSTIEGLAAQLEAVKQDFLTAPMPAMTRSARELRRIPAQAVDISS